MSFWGFSRELCVAPRCLCPLPRECTGGDLGVSVSLCFGKGKRGCGDGAGRGVGGRSSSVSVRKEPWTWTLRITCFKRIHARVALRRPLCGCAPSLGSPEMGVSAGGGASRW